MAAVGWVIWEMLPPSIIMPAMMPMMASAMPPMLAISIRFLFPGGDGLGFRRFVLDVADRLACASWADFALSAEAASGHAAAEDAMRGIRECAARFRSHGSSTTSFSPVMRVSTVSGADSAYLIRSQLTTRWLPFKRVNSIMRWIPLGFCLLSSFIGVKSAVNRSASDAQAEKK